MAECFGSEDILKFRAFMRGLSRASGVAFLMAIFRVNTNIAKELLSRVCGTGEFDCAVEIGEEKESET